MILLLCNLDFHVPCLCVVACNCFFNFCNLSILVGVKCWKLNKEKIKHITAWWWWTWWKAAESDENQEGWSPWGQHLEDLTINHEDKIPTPSVNGTAALGVGRTGSQGNRASLRNQGQHGQRVQLRPSAGLPQCTGDPELEVKDLPSGGHALPVHR